MKYLTALVLALVLVAPAFAAPELIPVTVTIHLTQAQAAALTRYAAAQDALPERPDLHLQVRLQQDAAAWVGALVAAQTAEALAAEAVLPIEERKVEEAVTLRLDAVKAAAKVSEKPAVVAEPEVVEP